MCTDILNIYHEHDMSFCWSRKRIIITQNINYISKNIFVKIKINEETTVMKNILFYFYN